MASFNNGHLLPHAVQSVLSQTTSDWELVIVDDGSSDDSVKVAQEFAAVDKRIRVFINEKNMGVGFTKKRGANECQGTLIGILDPDDALTPDALAVLSEAHASNPDAALCWSEHLKCDDQMSPIEASNSQFRGDAEMGYLSALPGDIHHFWTFKRQSYLQTAGFDISLRLAEDQDLFYKLEEVGATKHILNILYHYRDHSGAISLGDKTAAAFAMHLISMFAALDRRRTLVASSVWKTQCELIHEHYRSFSEWGIPKLKLRVAFRLAWQASRLFGFSVFASTFCQRIPRPNFRKF